MDRDEAIARGLRVHETQHSMKRRSPWHDYHGRGTYMLTLVVEGRMPLLGKLWGRVDARPGDGDAPKVMLSELGIAIAKEEIPKIHKYYPQVEVWRVCIMPDHIHLIVRVKEDLRGGQAMESLGTEARGGQASALTKEANLAQTKGANQAQTEGANLASAGGANQAQTGENEAGSIGMTAKREKEMGSLGMVIKGFKMGCNKAYWRIYGMNTAPRKGLFELGYNDKVLLHERQLEGWKKYLDDNPRRLMVKRMNPGLFTVMQNKEVAGRRCQMVGNCFLLDIPDKVAVVVHRRYSEEDLRRLREEWLACGERGGVLVSAAISTKEKEGIENVIKAMEAKKGDKMRYMANELEHLLSGLCNEGRQKKLRKSWLPHLLSTHEAERAWHDWLHLKGADCHKPDNLKMMSWLEDIETELSNIPALAPYSNDDKIAMLIRAHYTRIPLDKYRQLLTAFVIRDRLRMRLGLPTNSFAPTPSLTSQEEDYLIDKIIKYSQTLVRREDVEVLQRFIYHEISYLPPEYKLRVDNMTERFLSEEAREGIQINAIKEQTKALKEVAKKPTIQAEHYHAGNSTFDVHSKHLHLDHQEEGNSALLPSEL